MLDMVDAAALLWRLHLRGIDVGERWQTVADGFAPTAGAGNYAFNDLHAMMAFIGAGRRDLAEQVLAAQRTSDGAATTTMRPSRARSATRLSRAIQAFGDERYAEVVALAPGHP